jgi:predicted ATPase
MSRIKIKNFGPIKEGYLDNDGWINIEKVTVFIGDQGSGKSTVAKLFSTLTWLEKAINRGDVDWKKLNHHIFKNFFKYQRIQNYFRDDTIIEYEGDSSVIKYNRKLDWPEVSFIKNNTFSIPGIKYNVPKIMYVPAERNFLSVVKNAYGIKNLPDTLYTFAEELRKGQIELNGKLLRLPISKLKYKYNNDNETSYIVGENFELDILESSSGFQSFVPLYLVTKFLTDELQKGENVLREQLNVEQSVRRNKEIAEVMFNNSLTESEKSKRVSEIDSKYLNTCFINIVEEPEQNLFPISQKQMLFSLLGFNNLNQGNKLIMTTHSPYLINYLTLAVKADILKEKVETDKSKIKLQKIVPFASTVSPNDLAIYQLDEEKGIIERLETYQGLPSDENSLNEKLGESNELFAKLLEIQQGL